MIVGLGTDIVKVARFYTMIERNGGLQSAFMTKFGTRILNLQHELPLFKQFQEENDIAQGVRILSGSWCVKEAIYKSLDPKDQSLFSMRDWYKYNLSSGQPKIGGVYLQRHPDEEFLVSVSHDTDVLVASVLRQKKI